MITDYMKDQPCTVENMQATAKHLTDDELQMEIEFINMVPFHRDLNNIHFDNVLVILNEMGRRFFDEDGYRYINNL